MGSGKFQTGTGSIRLGTSFEQPTFRYALYEVSTPFPLEPRAAPLTAHHRGWHLRGVGGGDLSPGLSLRAGFRADRYSHEQRLRVSPRVALRLSLGERADLFAAAGRYHQVLPAPGLRAESATDRMLAGRCPGIRHFRSRMRPMSSSGWSRNSTATCNSCSPPLQNGSQDLDKRAGDEPIIRHGAEGESGRGSPSGVVRLHPFMVLGGRGSDRIEPLRWTAPPIHRPRSGTAGGIQVGGSLGYGRGPTDDGRGAALEGAVAASLDDAGPMSEGLINQSGGGAPLGLAPEDDFLRMDLEIAWPMNPRVAGRSTELRPYVKVLNALNRRDALFYYFDDGTRRRPDRSRLSLSFLSSGSTGASSLGLGLGADQVEDPPQRLEKAEILFCAYPPAPRLLLARVSEQSGQPGGKVRSPRFEHRAKA